MVSVQEMVRDYEDNIILPPPEFRDDYKPVPMPRSQKLIPASRTKIEQSNKSGRGSKKSCKAVGATTNEVYYFNSMYACARFLGCNHTWVSQSCNDPTGKADVLSKINRRLYHCYFVKPEDMPENFMTTFDTRYYKVPIDLPENVITSNDAQTNNVSNKNKRYPCLKCGKSYAKSYISQHSKICNK